MRLARRLFCILAVLQLVAASPLQAQELKTVTIKVGFGAGGGYDLSSRLIAQHLGRFLPSHPEIIVQNVTGGGSLKLTKMMLGSEPTDGSVIAAVSSGMAFAPKLDPVNADFDPAAIQWVGSLVKEPSLCITSKASGIDTMEKFLAGDFLVGASGKSALTYLVAAVVKNGLGAKFGIVTGFEGQADIELAIQRGEVAAECGIAYYSIQSKHLLDSFNLIGQFGAAKIKGQESLVRFSQEISDPVNRKGAEFLETAREFHLPMMAPAGTPPETMKMLRDAYVEMSKDPEFLKGAALIGLDVDVTDGQAIDDLVKAQLSVPPDVLEAARKLAQ